VTFPEILYARRDVDGNDSYFFADKDAKNLVEDDGPTEIAVYRRLRVVSYRKVLATEEAA
jgi:hypothetical protein